MYFSKTPKLIELAFPSLIWRIRDKEKTLYLTFDDGPDPEVTPEVLKLLDRYEAQATFFCVGQKVVKYPSLFRSLRERGHAIGNHTYHHLNGNKTMDEVYFEDADKAAMLINSKFFRPPYGKIRNSQIQQLKKQFHLIMWTVLTGDFDSKTSPQKVLQRAIRHTRKGSIIVFHDNRKFRDKMLFALEGFLDHFNKRGYRFEPITNSLFKNRNVD